MARETENLRKEYEAKLAEMKSSYEAELMSKQKLQEEMEQLQNDFNNKVHNVEEQYSGKTALTSVTPGGMGTGGQQEEGAISMIASANETVSIYSYLWGLPNSGVAVVWFTVDRNVMSWLMVVTMLVQELMTIALLHLVHWLKNNTMFLDACILICLIMWF